MLCHEVPCMAVRNLTLAILALRFKLPSRPVDEGTMLKICKTFASGQIKIWANMKHPQVHIDKPLSGAASPS